MNEVEVYLDWRESLLSTGRFVEYGGVGGPLVNSFLVGLLDTLPADECATILRRYESEYAKLFKAEATSASCSPPAP